MKGPEGKRSKTKNLGGASAQVESSSLQRTPASEDGGEALGSYWLMKSEPESRLEKGVDVKHRGSPGTAQADDVLGWCAQLPASVLIYLGAKGKDGTEAGGSCSKESQLTKADSISAGWCFPPVGGQRFPCLLPQARNFLRAMRLDEEAFFYHSNCRAPGIAGLVKIVKEAYPDHTQFEKNNPHYDSSSKEDNPKWSMVDVQFVRMMKRFIPLAELRAHHQAHKASGGPLKNMALFTHQRLSVQRLTREEFDFILSLEEKEPS